MYPIAAWEEIKDYVFFFFSLFSSNSADLILPLEYKRSKTNCPHKVTYTPAYIANPSAVKNLITVEWQRVSCSSSPLLPFKQTKHRGGNKGGVRLGVFFSARHLLVLTHKWNGEINTKRGEQWKSVRASFAWEQFPVSFFFAPKQVDCSLCDFRWGIFLISASLIQPSIGFEVIGRLIYSVFKQVKHPFKAEDPPFIISTGVKWIPGEYT